MTAFGGQIVVQSHAGSGTTFRVSLVAESSPQDRAHEAVKVEVGGSEARLRLLIVDDEEILARSLAKFFDSHLVTVATSGRAALELTRNHSYDCIRCDLMMPDVSGIDLHAELARAGRGQHRRMIFITGGAFTTRAREFIGEVENEVIEKPFPLARLKSAIVAVVNREGGMG